ncbi:hypothetical protein [Halopenitus persicus]|uniref:hypothetical protein n=1 Tax=Halopenitus persicus TaxID=1048396 RepID=UPI000BBB547E|nr:hypothetical protein [Halopenitus persicus]
MVSLTLLSTVLMGLLVIATFVAVGRFSRTPELVAGDGDRYDRIVARLGSIASSPTVWAITFVVFAAGLGLLTVLAVGSFGLPEGVPGTLLNVVYGLVGLLIAGFVFFGAYTATREHGLGNAQGVAAGSIALGMVLMLVIAIQLVVGFAG